MNGAILWKIIINHYNLLLKKAGGVAPKKIGKYIDAAVEIFKLWVTENSRIITKMLS